MILSEITRIRITVQQRVQDNLTQEQAEDVLNGCRMAGVRPHVEVWFEGTDFERIYAWLGPLLPQGLRRERTIRQYAPAL